MLIKKNKILNLKKQNHYQLRNHELKENTRYNHLESKCCLTENQSALPDSLVICCSEFKKNKIQKKVCEKK